MTRKFNRHFTIVVFTAALAAFLMGCGDVAPTAVAVDEPGIQSSPTVDDEEGWW